ncbi:hypothetical protein DFH09DRAFT_1482499 [Mycena vulgaris]|nr:hypothetical protein DFH09DRAFT_1482499 [Mycena vulgaris]
MSPEDHSIRRAFALAGEMWRAFLDPFTDGSLSLSEALSDLSKFAHLAFYFYRMHGSSFLSSQLYGDMQALVKAAFFCVVQQQNLDPTAAFFLYQIGSDRLEAMFAELSERLSSAADSVRIWNEHPDWHQGHVRRSWSGKEADHVNPTFFTGDMVVGNVVTETVWKSGGRAASDWLYLHGINFDFDEALSLPGVHFLRPNGGNIYPGTSKKKDRSIIEDNSTADILLTPNHSPGASNTPRHPTQPEDIEPVFPEDDAPTVFLEDFLPDESECQEPQDSDLESGAGTRHASDDWLEYPLENGSTKRLHKASVLSTLFNSDYRRLATTRLLRVRCYTADGHKPALNHTEISGEHSFSVGDLAVALIRSHNTVAAAVVRVTVLEKNKVALVLATGQPLILHDILVVGGDSGPVHKWIWAGDYAKFEPLNGATATVESGTRKALTVKIPGALLHPLDAEVESIDELFPAERESMCAKQFTHMWAVSNSDLMAVVSRNCFGFTLNSYFPEAPALILRNATQTLAQKQHDNSQKIACFKCHVLIKPDECRAHVGAHILRAMHCVQEKDLYEQVALPNPCGFCGREGCGVETVKSGQSFKTTSTCTRLHPFSYGHAKKYSAATPSTNVPIPCELCDIVPPRKTPASFWKYSMPTHIQSANPSYWDDLDGQPCNLPQAFAAKITISQEELRALGITLELSTAPPALNICWLISQTPKTVAMQPNASDRTGLKARTQVPCSTASKWGRGMIAGWWWWSHWFRGPDGRSWGADSEVSIVRSGDQIDQIGEEEEEDCLRGPKLKQQVAVLRKCDVYEYATDAKCRHRCEQTTTTYHILLALLGKTHGQHTD